MTQCQLLEHSIARPYGSLSSSAWRQCADVARTLIAEVAFQHHVLESWLLETGYLGDSQTEQMELAQCDLYPVVARLVDIHDSRATSRHVHLQMLSRDAAAVVEAVVNAEYIARATNNLLANAVKYCHKSRGGTRRHIDIWLRYHDSQRTFWCLGVRSYGIGIDEDELAEVLKPGKRGRRAIEHGHVGSGMGLAHVQRCATVHGGHVRLSSRHEHDNVYLTTVELICPVSPARFRTQR